MEVMEDLSYCIIRKITKSGMIWWERFDGKKIYHMVSPLPKGLKPENIRDMR